MFGIPLLINLQAFFYENRFFSTCLTFFCIEYQMLLSCCLIQVSIITLRNFLYLLYSCPCLDLGLFFLVPRCMSNIRDLFFIFIIIFITISCIISGIQTYLFFSLFFTIIFGWQGEWRIWITFKQQKFSLRELSQVLSQVFSWTKEHPLKAPNKRTHIPLFTNLFISLNELEHPLKTSNKKTHV